MVTLGTAQYTYEVAEPWAQLPEGWSFREVAAVGVDAQDQVYAFNRGAHPMMVFDRQGHFLRSRGEGVFTRAHGHGPTWPPANACLGSPAPGSRATSGIDSCSPPPDACGGTGYTDRSWRSPGSHGDRAGGARSGPRRAPSWYQGHTNRILVKDWGIKGVRA